MPYIDQESRKRLTAKSIDSNPVTAGELNWTITQLLDDYVARMGGARYAVLNEVIGVLECAKLELYRRIVAPYEDTKITENGDAYPNLSKKG